MKKTEKILRDAFSFYLGERKDSSFDCEPLIEYALPRLEKTIHQTLEEVKEGVEGIKEAVRNSHGTSKYDSCYDDCIKIINNKQILNNK